MKCYATSAFAAAVLMMVCAGSSTPAAIYYVDLNHPKASKDNPGNEEAPLKHIQQALDKVQPGDTVLIYVAWQGRISLLGCTRVSDANIDFYQYVHQRGVSLVGAHTFVRPKVDSYPGYWTTQDDFRTLLALIAARKLKVQPIISEIVSPESAPAIYKRLAEEKNPPLGIVFDWSKIR